MSTIKISELATTDISLTDFIAKADATGLASKNTIQNLSTFFETVGEVGFKGSLAIADVPDLDGWFFASETGTYTNAGGLVVDISDNLVIIIVSDTYTSFSKVDIPIALTFDSTPTDGSTNAVESNGVFDALALKQDTLTIDATVIEGSTNAVAGGGVAIFNSPFQKLAAVELEVLDAVLDVEIFGQTDKTKTLTLGRVRKNAATFWGLNVYESTSVTIGQQVGFFFAANYVPSADIETITLEESGSSGLQILIKIDWSKITDGSDYSNQYFDKGGLKYATYKDDAVVSLTSKDIVRGDILKPIQDVNDANTLLSIANENTINLVNKAGENTGVNTTKLVTSENVAWKTAGMDDSYHAVRLIMVSDEIVNKIKLPFRKNVADVDIVGDLVLKIGINGNWFYEKTITNSELVTWGFNAQVLATLAADSMYPIDIPLVEFLTGDDVYIGWGFTNPVDTMTFQYDNNDPVGTYYADRYIVGDATDINTITTVPTITSVGSWTFPTEFILVDYIQEKINNSITGVKPIVTNVFPDKIYTVCNDIDQAESVYRISNFSSMLYTDHFLKLTESLDVVWENTQNDKLPLFSPISDDGSVYNGGVDVLTTAVSENLTGDVQDITIDFDHISVKSSLSELEFPKVLFIGDSVTGGTGSFIPYNITDTNPAQFWSYITKLFYLDKVSNGNTGFDYLSLGVDDKRTFDVDGTTLNSYAEGHGGWTTRDFLYAKDVAGGNRFYDVAKVGTVKFSLTKYLERYKTLADDGVTRLVVGSTAGTEVTSATAYDVCTPTHVVIQTGFNDLEANWSGDIDLMIAEIKAEYPNMIIIISTIDAAGTYFPNKYPMFDKVQIDMLNDSLHAKMYNLVAAAKAKEDVPSKILYCPNYFVQPTAWGSQFREANPPEFIANPEFIFKSPHGTGRTFHPNTYAHSAWAYQLYSLIKYSLTL